MAKRQRHTPERILSKPREAEVKAASGTALAQVCKDLAITEQTYYRRREEYGGMKLGRAKRLKRPEGENARLKRLLADAELGKAILNEAASAKYRAGRSGASRPSTSGACSARTASGSAGPARSWGSAAPRSGARPPCPTTSPGR